MNLWSLPLELAEDVLTELAVIRSAERPKAFFDMPGQEDPLDHLFDIINGVAVIPVQGAITRSTEFSWWSGRPASQGQDTIRKSLDAALADQSVRSILLDVNSPGGVVDGTKELSDAIAAARTKKPCAAYANGLCASAAYWIASATGRVYAPLTASVGSIGVIMSVLDTSKLNEKLGISYNYISSGKWKAVGRGDAPLTDEERDYLQERISALHQIFKSDVSAHMGLTSDPGKWAEAQLLLAQPAKELGLVTDIVQDRDAAIRKLAVEAQMTREELLAQSPDLVEELLAEGKLKAEAQIKDASARASGEAVSSVMAVVRAMVGEETTARIETTLKTLTATGMSADQIATVAPMLVRADTVAPATQATAEAESRRAILAGLQSAHTDPVSASESNPVKDKKNCLVEDAKRRKTCAV